MLPALPNQSDVLTLDAWLPVIDWTPWVERSRRLKRLWLEPGDLLTLIHAFALAEWAIQLSYRLHPALAPTVGPGAPLIYPDAVVLLTVIVMRVWRKGYESFTGWLAANTRLAESLGYNRYTPEGRLRTISSSQLWKRTQRLGLLPFFLFFVGLAWQLMQLGIILGHDLILDTSLLKAWLHDDPEAGWSFPTRWRPSVLGYKIHTVLCSHFDLPVMFWVTPANVADCVLAIPLLVVTVALYGFQVWFVRADAAYFTWRVLNFVVRVLRASPMVDYNVRRRNRQLVTLPFMRAWNRLMGPRSDIERHYAWAKRYFGLKYFQMGGLLKVWVYCCCIYIAMLAVALAACRCGRPDLAGSRTNVLAWA
jgi:hypothetical protein